MGYLFTSESVSEGHPDKIADQISDALIDHFLAFDPSSKVACETLVTTGQVILAGEVKSKTYLDVQQIARDVIRRIGYTKSDYMFEANSCGVLSAIHEQSPDINQGVVRHSPEEQGAGDQGMMFGYASNEGDEHMPYALSLAHKLTRRLTEVRKNGTLPYLRPDGKSQVSVEYDENDRPVRLEAIVVSSQHDEEVSQDKIRKDIRAEVIDKVVDKSMVDEHTKIYINPTGRFVIGGPHGDAGLTGRKIIVDTYGGAARHGGGAFSGKDATKVDRSGAYVARYVAKNIVEAGYADKVEIQLSYAIGVAEPTSVLVDTFGTGTVSEEKLVAAVREVFDLRPAGIIKMLDLRRPIYRGTAAYGHFGRTDIDLPWEKTDKVDELKKILG